MKSEKIWKLIAKLCSRPAVAIWLINRAKKRPYKHLGGYMSRYWIAPEVWNLPFAIRIHKIQRADADPYLHDHPWDWRTIILFGSYVEEDVFGNKVTRSAGDTKGSNAETFHRVDSVSPGGVWTMFITGRRRNNWGFMIPKNGVPRKILHSSFNSTNGRMA